MYLSQPCALFTGGVLCGTYSDPDRVRDSGSHCPGYLTVTSQRYVDGQRHHIVITLSHIISVSPCTRWS